MSNVEKTSLFTEPGSIVPGHHAMEGTRNPPSQVDALPPKNSLN